MRIFHENICSRGDPTVDGGSAPGWPGSSLQGNQDKINYKYNKDDDYNAQDDQPDDVLTFHNLWFYNEVTKKVGRIEGLEAE